MGTRTCPYSVYCWALLREVWHLEVCHRPSIPSAGTWSSCDRDGAVWSALEAGGSCPCRFETGTSLRLPSVLSSAERCVGSGRCLERNTRVSMLENNCPSARRMVWWHGKMNMNIWWW